MIGQRTLGAPLCALALWAGLGGCGADDEGLSAQELADRLTDALDFEDAVDDYGDAPTRHDGGAAFPQITRFDAPAALSSGQSFHIDLHTDFDEPQRIVGVMVHADRAAFWLRVPAAYDDGLGLVRASAVFVFDEALAGKQFTLQLALIDDSGAAGNYVDWTVSVD